MGSHRFKANGQFARGPSSLNDGLVSHWKMGELGGYRWDSVGGMHLRPQSLTVTKVQAVAGKMNRAASFSSATDSYLYVPKASFLTLGHDDWAFAMWVKSADTGALEPIVAMYQSSAVPASSPTQYRRSWFAAVQWTGGADNATFSVFDDPGDYTPTTVASTTTTVTDTWHFLVCQHSGSTDLVSISLDGEALVTAAHSTGINQPDTGDFDVGRIEATDSNCKMESFSFWYGRTLSQAEVAALYAGGYGNPWIEGK